MLEKRDLKALRNADSVSFHYDRTDHYIVATRDRENTSTGFGEDVKIVVNGNTYSYVKGFSDIKSCFSWICSSRYAPHWFTITKQLRVNDEISLRWIVDESEWHKEKGLLIFDLRLRIARYTKAGKRNEYEYILDQRVGNRTGQIVGMIRFN